MCLVDGKQSIAVPIIAEDQELVHFNSLWCHLFHVLSSAKGMTFFQICPSKDQTIARLVDRVFPAIKSTKNRPSPFITTKTVAYIFSLIIDSVTVHHRDSPHSRALQHEATILHELDSMTPDAFRAELRASLTSFYEEILKVPGAGGRPQAKIIKRRFAKKPADEPADAPPSAEVPPAVGCRAPSPAPAEAGEAAAAEAAQQARNSPQGKEKAGARGRGGSGKVAK
jgi:hypothetical protein